MKTDEDYFIKKARELVGDKPFSLSEEKQNTIIKQCQDLLRPRTDEELEQIRKDIHYPGLPAHMRVRNTFQVTRKPRFFGINIRIGWWY